MVAKPRLVWPETALIPFKRGLGLTSGGQSGSHCDLGVGTLVTCCLWGLVWPGGLAGSGLKVSSGGLAPHPRRCRSLGRGARTQREPSVASLPVSEVTRLGPGGRDRPSVPAPASDRHVPPALLTDTAHTSLPVGHRDTHGLGVHEERGALGAGGEHLRGADELGPDAPEVVPQVTGRVTGEEAEPFLDVLKGKTAATCKGRC